MEPDDASRAPDGDEGETIGRLFEIQNRACDYDFALIKLNCREPLSRSYSPAGTRFNAFFSEPRSVMILSCKRVMA